MAYTDNLLVTWKICWSLFWSFPISVHRGLTVTTSNPKVLFLNKTFDFEVKTFEKNGRTDEI